MKFPPFYKLLENVQMYGDPFVKKIHFDIFTSNQLSISNPPPSAGQVQPVGQSSPRAEVDGTERRGFPLL